MKGLVINAYHKQNVAEFREGTRKQRKNGIQIHWYPSAWLRVTEHH